MMGLASKINLNPLLVLENAIGFIHDLQVIITKKERKTEIIRESRNRLESWLKNRYFDQYRNKKLDLAIVIYLDKNRYRRQDIDNIAKVILDMLKKDKESGRPYLFKDDSQVIRLLIYKIETKKFGRYKTNSLVISFREHDPKKQMILVEQNVL